MSFSDVVVVSEHRLYSNELHKLEYINDDFVVQAKASSSLRNEKQTHVIGHCGIAMFWKKSIAHKVHEIETGSDRICAVEVIGFNGVQSLFIVGVYLPQQACKITTFDHHLVCLNNVLEKTRSGGEVVVIGDFNCHFSKDYGDRFWGITTSNANKLLHSIGMFNLHIIDGTLICNGPNYTFYVDGVGKSYVDHCVISDGLIQSVVGCQVLEDCGLTCKCNITMY